MAFSLIEGLTLDPERQQQIREWCKSLAEVSDPVKPKELKAELRHPLVTQAPLPKPSPRQRRVIEMVAGGLKNREIAEHLGITEQVVKNHLRSIYAKTGAHHRTELALWYEEQVYTGTLQRRSDLLSKPRMRSE